MNALMILGLLLLGLVLWLLLERHENRRMARGLPRHSAGRLIFAAAAMLTMLFTGGCSLLFLSQDGGDFIGLVLMFGGIPFAGGLLVWWLAMRRKSG